MVGINSCSGGICCRYDGCAQGLSQLQALIEQGKAVLICPEVLTELPLTKPPAETIGGDGFSVWPGSAQALSATGEDLTAVF